MSQSDERHYYQPTFGFLFEDDCELLEEFDMDEYDLFWPADEGDDEDETLIDMYDQMSYLQDHADS